jgi:hypothetical protein
MNIILILCALIIWLFGGYAEPTLPWREGRGGAARNEWLPTTAGSLPSSPRQQKETITMKIKWHTVAEWDFSRWFALLSPLIGVLLGVLGVCILYR